MGHCVRARVRGSVQGVGFRYATLRKARELQIQEWDVPGLGIVENFSDVECEQADIVRPDMAPGDCLVFDLKTVHGAGSGRCPLSKTIRRMSLRFAAEDTIFQPRGTWTKETAGYLMSLGQKVGAPLDCPLLPTLWRAGAA